MTKYWVAGYIRLLQRLSENYFRLAIPSRHLCLIASLLLDVIITTTTLPLSQTKATHKYIDTLRHSMVCLRIRNLKSAHQAGRLRISNMKSAHICWQCPAWLQAGSVTLNNSNGLAVTAFALRDCALSISEEGGGIRFHAFLLLWSWPWPDDLDK